MPTPEQQDLIDRIAALLRAQPEIEAAWLAGSLGKDQGDAFSDVDILALASDGEAAALSAALPDKLQAVAKPVLVNVLFGGRVINVVTDDWRRFDINIVEEAVLAEYSADELQTLFNRGVRTPPTRPKTGYQTSPETLLKLVNEFLRVFGLAAVAMGREEYVLGLTGIGYLRNMTLDLMLEENSVAPWTRGGALHRNVFLSAQQQAELIGLPPLSATRDSLLEANKALAAVFFPRARRLAAKIGMAWPEAFEAATRRNLAAKLDLEF
jgi:predicted nucleotidyltransferase